ncbi:hypothetical protein RHSIM_Rhsim02G0224100 [Rhododendron simsii]|uniref:KIB1-4 beta-propeller domain-containing protein n=1 Tax=Rhododendron simsii TaxID=118357 RepID=A0A834HEA5_RHOSS|nr:hypothetical protein RHSIM_Rhsim02G0224100 [Rhododendron simsii]
MFSSIEQKMKKMGTWAEVPVTLRKGGVNRTVNLSEARGKRCLETLGWLVTLAEDCEMNLVHPFTRVQINLPHVTTFNDYHLKSLYIRTSFIRKAVLSSRPEESKDYVLVVLHGDIGHFGFWRPGDKSWTDVEVPILGFCDIIFHEDLLYAVKGHGMVSAFDVLGPYPIRPWFGLGIPDICFGLQKQLFIVESAGVVLMVHQDASLPDFGDDDPFGPDNKERSSVDYPTCRFQVFEFASCTKEWVEIMSLGNNALFLGENASISVDASRFSGMKANSIYYTDNFWHFYQRGGVNTGIYSLEDGSKSPCYKEESFNLTCPPLWVSPSSF